MIYWARVVDTSGLKSSSRNDDFLKTIVSKRSGFLSMFDPPEERSVSFSKSVSKPLPFFLRGACKVKIGEDEKIKDTEQDKVKDRGFVIGGFLPRECQEIACEFVKFRIDYETMLIENTKLEDLNHKNLSNKEKQEKKEREKRRNDEVHRFND